MRGALSLLLSGAVMLARAEILAPKLPPSPPPHSMHFEASDLVTPHVINGQDAGPGQFPYMALTENRFGSTCSGSILAPGWLISAAHCFDLSRFGPDLEYFTSGTATLGTNVRTILSDPSKHQVLSYFPTNNQAYNSTTFENETVGVNDIAVAKLGWWTKYPPLRLQTPELAALSEPGKTVTQVGWGCTQAGGLPSPFLQWAETTVVAPTTCQNLWPPGAIDPATMVCLNSTTTSTCPGDSGGPAVATNPANGWPYNIGVVSFGSDTPNVLPTVDTRITAFWDWIRANTGLSLKYYDVTDSSLRATDASPTTGYSEPGYVVPFAANKTKVAAIKDSWSVAATVPAGSTLLAQTRAFGLNVALFGVFPATYDRMLDLINYQASQCEAAKNGQSIKCIDATSSVTVKLVRGGHAKVSTKAKNDILLKDAAGLKALIWLENGDNYLIYNDKCSASGGANKIGVKC